MPFAFFAAANGITSLTGDVTATGPGAAVATIAAGAVTNAKLANMAASTVKGRAAGAGTGVPVDLTGAQAAAFVAATGAESTQTNAGAIGPAATVTFTSTTIVSSRTGLYLIIGNLSANASGVSTQNINLRRDAGAGGNLAIGLAGTGGAGPFDCTLAAVIQLVAGSSHTFEIQAIASAGTNTIPIGEASVTVQEL